MLKTQSLPIVVATGAAAAAVVALAVTFKAHRKAKGEEATIRECCHARVGLMGNPSDGFHGKTVSMLVGNFHATVTLTASARLTFVASGDHDPASFASLADHAHHCDTLGYYGGVRLLRATARQFFALCAAAGVPSRRTARNCTLSYETDIPRMVGMSGSSALVSACLKCLLRFYGLNAQTDLHVPLEQLPQVVLDVELRELGIAAGLQDRVIQVYGGLVHMDFDEVGMAATGHGTYTRLDPQSLPPLYLAWNVNHAGDSGRVHSDVRARWLKGDPAVVEGMAAVGGLADELRDLLCSRDPRRLALELPALMAANFARRRHMYGDAAVGRGNLAAVALARELGLGAKFTGSGGALVCVRDPTSAAASHGTGAWLGAPWPGGAGAPGLALTAAQEAAVAAAFRAVGFRFERAVVPPQAAPP